MEITSPADEGEPGTNRNRSNNTLLLPLFIVIIICSCKQSEKETAPPPVTANQHKIDSVLEKRKQERIADSLAKLKKKPITKKKIYLTFDDGPNRGTQNVLATVKEENIPVSFFVVGKHVFDSPQQHATWEMLKADSTIELCNHSFTHALNRYTKFYEDPQGVVNDFDKSQDTLHLTNRVARMPGRNAWRIDSIRVTDIKESRAAIDSVYKAGYDIMGWDIEWSFDHKTMAPDTATSILLRRIRNMLDAGTTYTPGHLVLLAHDQAFQKDIDIEQLRLLLRELKANEDYEFILAGQYPGLRKRSTK